MRVCGVSTDLALEAHDALRAQTDQEISGVAVERREFQHGKITTVRITDEYGAQAMGKPPGTYITIEAPAIRVTDPDAHSAVVRELAGALKGMIQVSDQGKRPGGGIG